MQTITDKPKSGAIGTISAFLLGIISQDESEFQTTVIFWFQVIAFAVSIIVGVFTIIGFCRKMKSEKREVKK